MTNLNKLFITAALGGLLAILTSCEVDDDVTSRTIERESTTSSAPSLVSPPLGSTYQESTTRETTIIEED